MYRLISTALLLVVILVTGSLFYRVMIGFFIPLFLAALLVVLFHPLHDWFRSKMEKRPKTAAMLTTAAILLIVLLPMITLLGVASIQATRVVKDINLGSIDVAFSRGLKAVGLELPVAEELEEIEKQLAVLNQSDLQLSSEREISSLEIKFKQLHDTLLDQGNGDHKFFTKMKEDLTALRSDLTSAIEATDTEGAIGADPYHNRTQQITKDYRRFANTISGGPVLGPLRQMVNPTKEKRQDWMQGIVSYIQPRVVSLTQATAAFAAKVIFGIAILMISIYFFLIDGPGMTNTIMALSPLDDRYERQLLVEFEKVSRAVVLATFLSALGQGVLATIGYYFAGIDSIVLLFLLTSFMALIPFLGAAAVWVPCCLWLAFSQNNLPYAIGLGSTAPLSCRWLTML